MSVLILGNGISRLSFDKEIRAFRGEIWGCNRIYIDYGDVLDALAGHKDVMEEAISARGSLKYKIFGIEKELSCKDIYRKDTGTTLVAEALTQGKKVICCGFDIGGLDVYSPGHEKKNKTTWVQRWRLMFSEFGSENVSFWGHDHKPFLLSHEPAETYSLKYTRGKSHIETDEYNKQRDSWGNDYSRIYKLIPCAKLINKSDREYKIAKYENKIGSGEFVIIPKT